VNRIIYVHLSYGNQEFSASVCLSNNEPKRRPIVSRKLDTFCTQLAEELRIVSSTADPLPVEETTLTSPWNLWKVEMYQDRNNPIWNTHRAEIQGVISEFVLNQGSPQAQSQVA
jgi:hypothetical protein